jgi:hypothetical protein
MRTALAGALLAIAILLIVPACQKQDQKQDQVSAAAEQVRAFAEARNPELKDEPLMMTVSRRAKGGSGDVCICIQVCSAHGRCTGCACSPASCGSCASASELAPIDDLFAAPSEMKK